jgi:hypothetical protein
VVGELGGADVLAARDRVHEVFGDGRVKPDALAGQEIGVGDLGQQCMPEAIGSVPFVDLEDLPGNGLARRLNQDVLFETRDRCEKAIVDARTGDRCDTEDALRHPAEGRDSGEEDVSERARDEFAAAAVGLVFGGEEFFREERVALGARVDPFDEAAGRFSAQDARELCPLFVEPKWLQFDPLDVRQAGELGQADEERMTALQVVAPVGAHEKDWVSTEVAGEEREQVTARGVAPVEILEDDHQRPVCAHARDEP